MIINNNKKFAFIHIQKTAGSSITKVLSTIPGSTFMSAQHSFITYLNDPNKYFKFAFVRNPWDRLYSWYNMMISKGKHNDFSIYLLNNSKNFSQFLDCTEIIQEKQFDRSKDVNFKDPYYKSISFNQLDYISNKDGKMIADFVGKFENLNEDFKKLTTMIDIPDVRLPHINRFNHDDYRKYYTGKDIEKVAKMYERDIKYFGYSF